jgi:hypothetical protein
MNEQLPARRIQQLGNTHITIVISSSVVLGLEITKEYSDAAKQPSER